MGPTPSYAGPTMYDAVLAFVVVGLFVLLLIGAVVTSALTLLDSRRRRRAERIVIDLGATMQLSNALPDDWSFIVCPGCLLALGVPPDQTEAEAADQVAGHMAICTDQQPPLPRATPPVAECSASLAADGGHCLCWRQGVAPCCGCNWPPLENA